MNIHLSRGVFTIASTKTFKKFFHSDITNFEPHANLRDGMKHTWEFLQFDLDFRLGCFFVDRNLISRFVVNCKIKKNKRAFENATVAKRQGKKIYIYI